jgi:adenosylhomocysteine nucleosidase
VVWQTLIRGWLARQVQQSAMDAVRSGNRPPDAPSAPCDVGIVFALGIESGGLVDLLTNSVAIQGAEIVVRHGELSGRSLVIVEAGVGSLAAARGTQSLLAGHRPAWVISAGFAGGLDPRIKRGDIVIADSLESPDGRRLAIDLKMPDAAAGNQPGLHVGRIVTSDTLLHRAADKRVLGERRQALAVDMESWTVGEVCRQAKTRFMAVRIISDAVDDELPADIERLARQQSPAARAGAVAGAVFRRPSSIKDMLKLKEEALISSDRLAKFLAGIICQLPARKE